MRYRLLSKRIISIFITVMMLVTMLPATSVHTHAAVDNSGVTLEYSGTEVADSTIINNTNQMVKVYTITDSGEYVLKTSGVSEYGVAIILDSGVSDVRLVLDNVSIFAQKPIMPDVINDISYNNSIHGGLVIYNNSDDISDLEIIIKGSNTINVASGDGSSTTALLVRGCNTNFYGESEDNNLILSNNSSSVVSYGIVNLTKDGFVGGSVPFETAPYLGINSDANISVDVQQGSGIITARDINMFDSRLFVHSYGIAIQSYVDEGILGNGYYGLYVENSTLSVDTSGAGIGINNGGVAFVDGTDVNINVTGIALTVCSGNITFDNINNVDIRSNDGYGLSLNDSALSVEFNSNNVSIYGERYAIIGTSQYVTTRGFVGNNEIITLHSDDGINYSEYTDDETTKKYVKTSTRAHTHDFGEDYYESDVAGYHYKLCDCGEKSELEECTYSFHYFESAPDIENDGVKVYFCDYCGGRKDVTVPAHDCNAYTNFEIDDFGNHYGYCTYVGCERFIDEPHNLELLEELDDNSHKHICAVCDYYETEEHLFVEFEYIDEDTHEAYCECGYTGVKPHEYFEFSGNNDGVTHTGYCYCGAEITGDHNWGDWTETDNGYVHSCDDCGATESCTHEWSGWSYDDVMHSRQCTICPAVEENEHHSEAGFIDMGIGHYMICDECEIQISLPHEYEKCGDNGDGTHTKYCFCGATVTEGHNWGDWEEAADGSGTFHTCIDCNATEYCSHEWSEWYGISNLQHQHKCEICGTTKDSRHTWGDWTDNGTTHSHECTGCGWRITEEHDYINIWDDENGTTHTAYCICGKGITSEHDWSPWIDTEDGQHRRECNECGAEEIGEHNWGEWESINEESHQRFCLDCESAREEASHNLTENWVDIGEDGHRFGCVDCDYGTVEPHEINEWLPGEDGETHVGYCFCGAVIVEEHQWSEWTDLGNRHERSCTVCGETQSGSHSVSSYTYDDEGHRGECDYCHRVYTGTHSYISYNSIDNHSHQSSCNVCGYVETSAHTPLLGYVNNGDGTHSATCSKCRDRYTAEHNFIYEQYDIDNHKYACDCCNEDELLPHNWSEWESLADGSCVRYCLDCNQEHICSHESITYIHNENNHTGICDTCGWTKTSEHKNEDGFIPNNDGKHYYVCVCGYCYVEDHSFVCTDNRDGTHTATCICGATEIADHDWSDWKYDDGKHYRDCSTCNAHEEDSHNMDYSGEFDDDTHQYGCATCGYYIASDHDWYDIINNGDGTHTSFCQCGKTLTIEHKFSEWYENGSEHYRICSCGATETAEHDWGDWVSVDEYTHRRECSECGAYETGSHSLGSVETHDETNHKYACSTCEYFETENHNFEFVFDDLNGETHTEKCMCGEMHSVAHDYTSHIGDTGDGVNHNAYCECGAYTAEEHVYNTEFSDAGDGTHYVHCLCGAYTIQEHTYDQVIVTREPVDGMPGEKQHTCQCGATSYSTEFISYIDINDDGVIDVEDYQIMVNEVISGENEQSGTAEYDEIIKYDLNGDGYVDALDTSLMSLVVRGHKSFADIQNGQRGDIDFDGEAFTEDDLIELYYILSDIELSALTLSTNQKFAADLNCNGRIDEDDYILLQQLYPGIHDMV